jgi:hypothetical protein
MEVEIFFGGLALSDTDDILDADEAEEVDADEAEEAEAEAEEDVSPSITVKTLYTVIYIISIAMFIWIICNCSKYGYKATITLSNPTFLSLKNSGVF